MLTTRYVDIDFQINEFHDHGEALLDFFLFQIYDSDISRIF